MRLTRLAVALASTVAFAACDGHFLDPDLAGLWGGDNFELTIDASSISVTMLCNSKGRFPGDVQLDEHSAFYRDGQMAWSGTRLDDVRLGGSLSHPDTMRVMIYHPGNPLEDPAVFTLVRGQPATWNSRIMCAS